MVQPGHYDQTIARIQKGALDQYKSVSQSQGNELKKEQKQEVKQDVNKDNKQNTSKEIDNPKQTKQQHSGPKFYTSFYLFFFFYYYAESGS